MLRILRLSSKQSSKNSQTNLANTSPDSNNALQAGLQYKRIGLRPIDTLEQSAWKRIHNHFRDKEIAHLNGTKPSRMPLWLLKRVLKTDAKRIDRETYGIYAQSLSTSQNSTMKKVPPEQTVVKASGEFNKFSQPNYNSPLSINKQFYYHQYPEYIGTVELYDMNRQEATLGIIIGEKDYWSKGYGPEAIHALLYHAFDTLGLKRVKLNTYGDNIRAQRSFKRIGFVETKRVKNYKGREDIYMEIKIDAWRELIKNPPPWHMAHVS